MPQELVRKEPRKGGTSEHEGRGGAKGERLWGDSFLSTEGPSKEEIHTTTEEEKNDEGGEGRFTRKSKSKQKEKRTKTNIIN